MKISISIILASICIMGLTNCGTNNNPNTKAAKNQSVEQKQSTEKTQKQNDLKINLTKENKIISVKNEKDIYNGLYDAVTSRSSIVNFDISNYDTENLDIYENAADIVNNNIYSLVYEYPESNVIEKVESTCDKKNKLIHTKIYYYYFEKNNDIFMPENNNEIAVMLNKRILKKGDKAKIYLLGNSSEKYDIQYIPKNNNIITLNKNGNISTLKAGETDIDVNIISKEDRSKIYSGILKIKVLPEDTVEVANIKELRKTLAKKIGTDSVNIYVKNIDADIFYEGLESIISPHIFFTANNDYTSVSIHYEESKDKALNNLKEIDNKSTEIIKKIITLDMTDEEKIETIYDYIINTADYDMEYYSNNKIVDFTSRTAYGILLNGKGICGGFADSINILLKKAGIESYCVSGNSGGDGHMWNIVKLNGEYRYFDATFDNTYSTKEKISHEYFNITEEKISNDHEWYKKRFNKFLKALKDCK